MSVFEIRVALQTCIHRVWWLEWKAQYLYYLYLKDTFSAQDLGWLGGLNAYLLNEVFCVIS